VSKTGVKEVLVSCCVPHGVMLKHGVKRADCTVLPVLMQRHRTCSRPVCAGSKQFVNRPTSHPVSTYLRVFKVFAAL